jgi:hypothetical protein
VKKTLLLCVLALFVAAKPGRAQFGGIVYDPTNFHNAVLRYYQLRAQLAQMQATYAQVVNQYRLAVAMARSLQNMPARYRAYFSQWRNLTTVPDAYHNTGQWVSGVNTGSLPVVLAGYQRATEPLERYTPQEIQAMPPEDQERSEANFASVELADGMNTSAMTTIGNMRADARNIQQHISNLESDSLSSNPSLNSQIGVLNKINATNVLILRSLQDSNNLRLSELEQQVVQSKRLRDDETAAINSDVYQRANMVREISQFTTGLGETLAEFRLP